MTQVVISRCADYQQEAVYEAVRRSIDLLGGISNFVQAGQKALLKVNLLIPAPPQKAVTTHPAVVEAMVRLVQEAGGSPLIADSPGNGVPYTKSSLRRVYKASGMLEVAERTGAALNWDTRAEQVSHPEGLLMKRLDVIKPLLDADVVISMPKLKTHVLTTFTGATKNLFGVVPGYAKPLYHAKLHAVSKFAGMLLDIISYVKPALALMDGIVGMEGNGPSGGLSKEVGVILASRDSVALDVVATSIVGIEPLSVPTLREAWERGLWSGWVEDIEILGGTIQEVFVSDFVKPMASHRFDVGLGLPFFDNHIRPFLVNRLTIRPVPQRSLCTACRTCVRSCPQGAITIVDKLAIVDYRRCIRCYCCHELCPEGAIELERPWLSRLLSR